MSMIDSFRPSQEECEQLFSQEQEELIAVLGPNCNPAYLQERGLILPMFFYGTLLPGQSAGEHFDPITERTVGARLESTNLVARKRHTHMFGREHYPLAHNVGEGGSDVKGMLVILNKESSDGSVDYARAINTSDQYEELDNELYTREVVKVVDEFGKKAWAMAYIATDRHLDRAEYVARTARQVAAGIPKSSRGHYPGVGRQSGEIALYLAAADDAIDDGDFARYMSEVD